MSETKHLTHEELVELVGGETARGVAFVSPALARRKTLDGRACCIVPTAGLYSVTIDEPRPACSVCGEPLTVNEPSGVCGVTCLRIGEKFTRFKKSSTPATVIEIETEEHLFRLVQWQGECGGAHQVLSRAPLEPYDAGDAEHGPRFGVELGEWKVICEGFGTPESVESLICRYHCTCDKASCDICHPGWNFGQ